MAQRRMFSLKIVDTDAFLDMPMSSRLLYYDLSMRADDDGFVGSPKKITKMVGCSDDDLKLLIAKQFLIPFESGVCVIKDWRVHNYIQKDRYQPTQYADEKSQLNTDSNGSYQLCIQNVSSMDTQDRLGKVRLEIGKDKVTNYYEQKIGSMTSAVLSDIQYFVGLGFEESLIIHCLNIAVDCNARNKWTYTKGILKNLLSDNILTLANFQKEEVKSNVVTKSPKRTNIPKRKLSGVTYLSADAAEIS